MFGFVFGLMVAVIALMAAFFRLLARTKEFRKPREGLNKGEAQGEEFQDLASLLSFFATFLVVMGAILVVDTGVSIEVRRIAAIAFLALALLGLGYIVVLTKRFPRTDSKENPDRASV